LENVQTVLRLTEPRQYPLAAGFVLSQISRVNSLWLITTAVGGYLLGSIPTGFLIAKSRGVDIRKTGSGNIGAANAFRVLGKGAGTVVLFIDAAKGLLAVIFLPWLVGAVLRVHPVEGGALDICRIIAGVSAIIGHNFSCWLRLKGGKGIATTAGVMIALAPLAFLSLLAVWLGVFALSRYVSLASIVAAACLPLFVFLWDGTSKLIWFSAGLGALAVFKHRSNIARLLNGTELRAGRKKSAGETSA
jgi:acyl phosphate:glycerol-3-phosphate acyltransferase